MKGLDKLASLLRELDWSDDARRERAISQLAFAAIEFDRLYAACSPAQRQELRGIIELMVQDVAEAEPRAKLSAVR